MSRYIDRDLTLAGIEDLKKSPWYNGCNGNYERLIRREAVDIVTELCIKQVPTADVAEVKHGEWTKDDSDGCFCSFCGWYTDYDYDYVTNNGLGNDDFIYCSHCGARMDGGTNDEM